MGFCATMPAENLELDNWRRSGGCPVGIDLTALCRRCRSPGNQTKGGRGRKDGRGRGGQTGGRRIAGLEWATRVALVTSSGASPWSVTVPVSQAVQSFELAMALEGQDGSKGSRTVSLNSTGSSGNSASIISRLCDSRLFLSTDP